MHNLIKARISESIQVKQDLLEDQSLLDRIAIAAQCCIDALLEGNKIMLCGNGGSAADAQHIAAELSGRFKRDREPLFAIALHANSSYVTAVANDYGYADVFARAVNGMGKTGDVLIALSTSGESPNILNAVRAACEKGIRVIGMTGESGGAMAESCDTLLNVPDSDTARIQEAHILLGHILCELIEPIAE